MFAPRRILLMTLGAFALVPGRAAVFAERARLGRIGATRDLQRLGLPPLLPQRGQYALGRKWSLAQTDTHGIVNRVGDGRDVRAQGPFPAFLAAKCTSGIDGFHDAPS